MSTAAAPSVVIDVWSDYVCPFCFLEQPVLDQVRAACGDQVQVRWHAFELRPAPVPTLDPDGDYLHTTWQRAVYPMAAERGLTLKLPPVQPRSRKAMEAAEFARDAGHFDAMHDALFRAFFQDGSDLADIEVLVATGRSVGLDGDALRGALIDGRHTAAVVDDQRLARQLGISGVPMLVVRRADDPVGTGEALSGAQPYPAIAAAVERALTSA